MSLDTVFDMTGRIAIVTGGGTGIGLAIATGLAKNGAKVYITGRRSHILENAARDFQGSGSLVSLQMDVTDEESIKKGVQLLTEKEGKLDVLINNAGTNVPPSQPDFPDKGMEYYNQGKLPYELETFEGWTELFRINTLAPFFVTTAFLDLLIKGALTEDGRKTSIVINVSTIATHLKHAFPLSSLSYPFAKRALEQISTFMAADLAKRKVPVRVVALAPGFFPSELTKEFPEEYQTAVVPNFSSPIPLLRWGKPEEIALTANYVVANEYVNGIVLPVDGGFTLVNF